MIDERGKHLLSCLRKNSRNSLSQISKDTGIAVSTLFDKLKKLESKFVTRHTSLLDYSSLGFDIRSFFAFSANDKEHLKNLLLNSKYVNTLSSLVGDFDFIAECVFKDNAEYNDFKLMLSNENISTIETPVLEDIKREGFYT